MSLNFFQSVEEKNMLLSGRQKRKINANVNCLFVIRKLMFFDAGKCLKKAEKKFFKDVVDEGGKVRFDLL